MSTRSTTWPNLAPHSAKEVAGAVGALLAAADDEARIAVLEDWLVQLAPMPVRRPRCHDQQALLMQRRPARTRRAMC